MAVQVSLKGLRANSNLSLEEVASKLGITRVAYTNKETGKTKLSLEEGFALADLFGCSITDIYEATKV